MKNREKPLILVVDDNFQNLQFIGSHLKENGYEPALTASGIQALNFSIKQKPDLILLDIMMPEMDGYEVCERLKSDRSTKHIPIIFLTAKTGTEDIVRGFEAGAVDYVTKPFNSTELLARIKTHIQLKRSIDEIKTLRGIIPICAKCKKIRNDEGLWSQIELYIENNSEAAFSHAVCPECEKELYGHLDWYRETRKNKPA